MKGEVVNSVGGYILSLLLSNWDVKVLKIWMLFVENIDDIQGHSSSKELWGAGKMAQWVKAPTITLVSSPGPRGGRGETVLASCPPTSDTHAVAWIPLPQNKYM